MKKFFKRLTANLLAVTMAVTTFVTVTPAQVFAAEEESVTVEESVLDNDVDFDEVSALLSSFTGDEVINDNTPTDSDFATIGDANIDNLGDAWPFKDLAKGATGATEAYALYNLNIISGFNKDSSGKVNFKPNNNVTRAQFALMIYKFFVNVMNKGNKPIFVHTNMKYTDIPKSGDVYDAIRWCDYCKIISGFSETSFKPDKIISRDQISLMLINFARRTGADTTARESLTIKTYPDCGNMQFNFKDSMGWCLKTGVLSGIVKNGKTYIKGSSPATRVQCAIFLYRFGTRVKKGSVSYESINRYTWGQQGRYSYKIVTYAPDIFEHNKSVTTFGQLKCSTYNMVLSFSFSSASNFNDAVQKVVANENSLGEVRAWHYNNGKDDYVSYGSNSSKWYLQRIRVINGKICSLACEYPKNGNAAICYDLAIDFITSMNCIYTYN